MSRNQFSYTPHMRFEIHQVNSTEKTRDSPTSSILKTPTAIFVTTRNSSSKTRRLKFANGPVDLQSLKNGTHDANVSVDSGVDTVEEKKYNNGEISFEENIVEVAISPVKTMQVSPESWRAFLEYKKYNDYSNETEKTDYTYSRLSKFRHKEIIPGFLIRPNLSRSSISSRRSSAYSLPGSQSSFSESYNSGSYDFKVHNQSNPDIIQDLKISNQPTKFVRSKYNLRSSNFDWKDTGEEDSNAQNYKYVEKGYYDHRSPVEEKFTKSYAYSTNVTETSDPTTHYYGSVRSLDLDDANIDEVDVNPVFSEKRYYTRSSGGSSTGGINTGRYGAGEGESIKAGGYGDGDGGTVSAARFSGRGAGGVINRVGVYNPQSQTVTDHLKTFFTTVFLYVTSIGPFTRDLFSKHILRRQDDRSQYPSAAYDWRSDSYGKLNSGSSWMPWIKNTAYYTTGNYYSGDYYGQPGNWYQRIYYYFNDKYSQLTNFIWGNTASYGSYRYHDPTRKKGFWWLLIPLLLLGGSFLGYIDFFSNPKAILNTMYNWALFVPSFLHYTVMVFLPWLIFEAVPHLVLILIPNFVLVTLPYFLMTTVPYYFWVVVHFLASLTLASVWNMIVGAVSFTLNFLFSSGSSLFNLVLSAISTGYVLSSQYLMLFYSNFCMQVFDAFTVLFHFAGLWLYRAEQDSGFLSSRYKELDCSTNGLLTSVENTIKPVWRSGYVAYKRAAVSASCYVNDSLERLKLPFTHINEWLCSKLSSLSEGSLGVVFTIWNVLWQGLWNVLTLARDTFSNTCLLIIDFFTDFLSAVNNVLYYIYRYFMDSFFTVCSTLGWIFGNAWKLLANTLHDLWSYLYLLLFVPRSEIKYNYQKPDSSSGEICMRQQKSIDKLTNEMQDFKSITWDLSSLKKKIDELEAEFRKEKEHRRNQNELIDKQMDDNHKILQKYQATVNHALHSTKRPSQVSGSSIQYLLDNQSDTLKQWITQNFLLKSDSTTLDENKVALLIAKYGNKTGEELIALRRELELFIRNHKNDFESLRNNFNTLEMNNMGSGDISLAFIKKLISDAIKLYDADKTGRVDYALETAGGQVQSIRCTETYMESPKSYVLWRWSVYTEASSPREAIRPGMAAGQCWAFVGAQGFLVLQLSHTIRVTGFTMEHISKSLVPRGHIESAPKTFSMWGLRKENDLDPYLFGEYVYLDNDETLQYFPVMYPTNDRYKLVELKITSNHGNPNYTCLYRIRVHGDVEPMHL